MTHPAFQHLRSHPVPALRLEFQEYRHRVTGARHLHLAADDPHNAFMVAFLTVPQDSTGVAHILEHTALCGSRRYPVRDPFFMMIRRSLNTFMNAFTSSDWTAYPFASQNKKDFNNLLDVYLDAAFFPAAERMRLRPGRPPPGIRPARQPAVRTAVQGRRVQRNERRAEFAGAATRPGIATPAVPDHHLSSQQRRRSDSIPDLTHEQLKAFHARHYHPSNAIFLTYGDIPAAEHQERFENQALSQFQALPLDLAIPDERRYAAPVTDLIHYPLDGTDDLSDQTHIVLGWLLGPITDPLATLAGAAAQRRAAG